MFFWLPSWEFTLYQLVSTLSNPLVFHFSVECSGHAASVVKTYDLSLVTGIILCSGDGLLYEVRSFVWSNVQSTKLVLSLKHKVHLSVIVLVHTLGSQQ